MKRLFLISAILVLIFSTTVIHCSSASLNSTKARATMSSAGPILKDPSIQVKRIFSGLRYPTSMAFLGPDDILVLEKDEGTVQRIVNGNILGEPLLQVKVDRTDERGMLGIAVSRNETKNTTYVFLYYTEFKPIHHSQGITLGNRLYRYELVGNKLVNPKLLLDLPVNPGPDHNGGKIKVGSDGNVYLTVGEMRGSFNETKYETKAQNYRDGPDPDGRAGILRVTQDGKPVAKGIIGERYPLNLYYAYGIKNSFGMDFDPITRNLWDTENGPTFGDEINLVKPGFNSGWSRVQGIWTVDNKSERIDKIALPNPSNLVTFNGKGKYSKPEFTWLDSVGPTALTFVNSDKLGKRYVNDMFVGDIKFGNIYDFKLNYNRTELVLNDTLADKVADNLEEANSAVFGSKFGGITDLTLGPNGYLYVLVFDAANGTIFEVGK